MKKYIPIIFISVFLCFNKKVKSQALPIYSQYMFNEYLINSAYAGTYYFTPIIIYHRNQWIGFGDSAPQTSSISINSGLGKKSALGTSMIYDQTSPISRTQIEMSYAYNTQFLIFLTLLIKYYLNYLIFLFSAHNNKDLWKYLRLPKK